MKEIEDKEPSLYEIVSRCFGHCIEDGVFLIGIDKTGVYLFTESRSIEIIHDQVAVLKECLQITDDDMVLCVVGAQLGNFQCYTAYDVEKMILDWTTNRKIIFDKKDLKELEECWDEQMAVYSVPQSSKVEETIFNADAISETRKVFIMQQIGLMILVILGFSLVYFNILHGTSIVIFAITLMMTMRLNRSLNSYACFILEIIEVIGILVSVWVLAWNNHVLLFHWLKDTMQNIHELFSIK